jgi:hypothetical protein
VGPAARAARHVVRVRLHDGTSSLLTTLAKKRSLRIPGVATRTRPGVAGTAAAPASRTALDSFRKPKAIRRSWAAPAGSPPWPPIATPASKVAAARWRGRSGPVDGAARSGHARAARAAERRRPT